MRTHSRKELEFSLRHSRYCCAAPVPSGVPEMTVASILRWCHAAMLCICDAGQRVPSEGIAIACLRKGDARCSSSTPGIVDDVQIASLDRRTSGASRETASCLFERSNRCVGHAGKIVVQQIARAGLDPFVEVDFLRTCALSHVCTISRSSLPTFLMTWPNPCGM